MDDETPTPDAPEDAALVPVVQKTVNFYGDPLVAAQDADEIIYVPLRPLTDHLGLAWPGQFMRLKRDPVLSQALRSVIVTITGVGERTMVCLPLKLLPGFLFGIQASRVRADLREKILRYQQDCYEVLWNAFKSDILPTPALPPPDTSLAEQALVLAEAVVNLARQQLELEGRYTTMADYMRGYVQQTTTRLGQHEARLTALELRLDPKAVITEEQAAELALAVKHVGQQLAAQGDKNGYARVYSELYRRYRISSYKNLPQAKFDEVLAWLHGWHAELSGE